MENFHTSHQKLLRLANRIVGNLSDAEDVLQDCYEKFFLKKDSYDLKSSEAFLMTMVRNACLDLIKKKHTIYQSEDVLLNYSSSENPEKLIEFKESENRLDKILNQLNEKHRTIYHLREIEGYELEEIAKVLSITNEDVRTCLSRARKKVRELYLTHFS